MEEGGRLGKGEAGAGLKEEKYKGIHSLIK
jgi:hypothetical protein